MTLDYFIKNTIPEKYRSFSLENCHDLPRGLIEYGKEWGRNWPLLSLFLLGIVGSGKTCFAYAILREFLQYGKMDAWPKIYTSPELDAILLEAAKSSCGDRHRLQDLSNCDILFIDDIGRETKSERLKRQYFEFLNKRYVHQKPTIMTSNFPINDLKEIFDPAIASRMQEWETLEFPEKDLRNKPSRKFH